MLKVKSNNVVRQLPEMKELCQPNLLDNADFKSGIINQRNFVTQTVTGWAKKGTIDRWIFSGSGNATATLDDTKVSISGDSSLIQTLDKVAPIGTYTLATKIESLSGTLKVGLIFSDDSSATVDVESIGLFVHTFTTSKGVKSVMFRCDGAESNFSFSGAKLETGSIFTSMPQWDEQIEYLKCRKYFYTLGGGWNNMFHARTDENYISIYIPILTPMAKTPSLVDYANESSSSKMVSIRGNDIAQGTSLSVPISEFTQSANKTLVTLSAPLNGRSQIGYGGAVFRFACGLDAETY